MKILLALVFILLLAACSDDGQHYDDPWNPPTADRGYDDEQPVLVTDTIRVNVKS